MAWYAANKVFGWLIAAVLVALFVWPAYAFDDRKPFWTHLDEIDGDEQVVQPQPNNGPQTTQVTCGNGIVVANASLCGPNNAPGATAPTQPNNQPAPTSGGGQPATLISTQDSTNCKNDAWAKSQLGVDVQGIGGEDCGWVIRTSQLGSVRVTCPVNWTCTLALVDETVKVFRGDGSTHQATAGTLRYAPGYRSGDAVRENPPCTLLRKEHAFGQSRNPAFPVFAGNFSC
jgi:hypothetical protein